VLFTSQINRFCKYLSYPDVVSAAVEVTTENLPVTLVTRATGKLDALFVADNEIVEKDRYLAVIENPADFGDGWC